MHDHESRPGGLAPIERDDAFAERLAIPLRPAERPDPRIAARVLAAVRATADGADASPPMTLVADRPAPAATPRCTCRASASARWCSSKPRSAAG